MSTPRRPLYSPTGEIYTIVPRTLKLPQCAEDVLRAVTDIGRRGVEVRCPDWLICEYLASIGKHHSRRYVQKGLKALQDMGLIVRETVRRITRGAVEVCRQISILMRYRGEPVPAPKVKVAKKLTPKIISHDSARGCDIHLHDGALSSLSEETSKEKQAVVGDEGDGTPSPPPADEPIPAADAMAVILAAAKAARTPQDVPAPVARVVSRSAPAVTPRAALRLALVRDVAAYERMAAEGDAIAAGELPFVRARLEQHDAKYPPADGPPGVGSAPPIADPPA